MQSRGLCQKRYIHVIDSLTLIFMWRFKFKVNLLYEKIYVDVRMGEKSIFPMNFIVVKLGNILFSFIALVFFEPCLTLARVFFLLFSMIICNL